MLYKYAPTAAKLTVLFFHAISDEKGKLFIITTHTANNAWGIISQGTILKEPYEILDIQNKYLLEAIQFCTQNERTVKSDNTLPESNTRWRITRAMYEFSGVILPSLNVKSHG